MQIGCQISAPSHLCGHAGTYYDMLVERLPDMCGQIAELRASHVLADRDEWGYLLQLFTRSPHERNTLFYELIQRRGPRDSAAPTSVPWMRR